MSVQNDFRLLRAAMDEFYPKKPKQTQKSNRILE